ncbi:MAG: DUF3800 domain-containing protein [Akkermansiaceae bacterium]|nr:DUF3800 domain-containing protein [Armatimonadota bacterium]
MPKNTFAFVDESGDTGVKLGQGSSDRMVVVLVMFETEEDVQAADKRINALRAELRQSLRFEFHFKDNSNHVRAAFFNAIALLNFGYVAVVVDKDRWADTNADHSTFYKQTCLDLLEVVRPFLLEATVKLGKSGAKQFWNELASELKRQINAPKVPDKDEPIIIKSVSMQESHTDNLLQMADMICGAVARPYRDGRDRSHEFVKIIAHCKIAVRELPESILPAVYRITPNARIHTSPVFTGRRLFNLQGTFVFSTP